MALLYFSFITRFFKYTLFNFVAFTLLLSSKRYFISGILFYEGIVILILTTVLLLFHLWKSQNTNNKIHKYYSVIISFFIILSFHTTVITIVDRSISVFIISNIKNGVDNSIQIRENFIENFTKKGIDKRILEQQQTGNVKIENGNLKLTWKGKIFYNTFKFIQILYNTDKTIFNNKQNLENK